MVYYKQPIRGFIYIVESQGYHKIGWCSDLKKRMRGYNLHNPQWTLLFSSFVNDSCKMEQYFLNAFKEKSLKGEWFKLNDTDLDFIKKECEKHLITSELLD